MNLTKIKKITKSKARVYDITVANDHNFFINKHLIHNCDYTGEIKVILLNTSNEVVSLPKGAKIAQMVFQRVPLINLYQLTQMPTNETRGVKGFGSSGQ